MLKYRKKFVYSILIALTLIFCSAVFAQETAATKTTGWSMQKIMDRLQSFVADYGLKVIGAIVILIVGRIAASIVRSITKKIMKKARVDDTVASFFATMVYFIILAFTVIAALSKFGIETASFVAILGAAAFAIGFALQGSLANFASGVMILLFRPYKIGDFVDVAGVAGVVKDVHIFNTTINTPDNIKVIVPNSKIYGDVIKNVTGYDTRRIDMVIGISYGSPIGKAIDIAVGVMKSDPRVLADPAPQVAVSELADSSVNLVVRPWVKTTDYWGAKFDITRKIKEEYDANGIEIPFPQHVVHMSSESND